MKTAVVTGGSSGIGLSCCRKFLENGYRVYELSRREPKVQTVGVKHISCDVTDEHSVSEAFKKIYNDSGSIDILEQVVLNFWLLHKSSFNHIQGRFPAQHLEYMKNRCGVRIHLVTRHQLRLCKKESLKKIVALF